MLNKILNTNQKIDKDLILKLISFIDLTTLNDTDNNQTVLKLVEKANKGFKNTFPAAVCVFSNFGNLAKENVSANINVAVVSTCFPTGQTLTQAKLSEIELVNNTKIDEVDVVINRGEFLAGNLDYITNELVEIRKRLPNKHLKVILETGQLKTEEDILVASKLAMASGADFIKTSTGKAKIGSTPEAVFVMCKEIKRFYIETGKKIGIKPAGGIRTLEDALTLYKIVNEVLGKDWLTPKLFRIGASSLYDNLIESYNKL
ncbi:MAG TPA: deoxyribose-phosphate aldolase [Crocinitomix sp.]|nr:deoxyribose-phosphate aldolase [Crocinitomix sp.]